ncbi:hypothetical protein Tco_0433363 [Tanacetum coccineum]
MKSNAPTVRILKQNAPLGCLYDDDEGGVNEMVASGWRVTESEVGDWLDPVKRSILELAGKIPPEKFSGGCGGGRRWWGFTGEESGVNEMVEVVASVASGWRVTESEVGDWLDPVKRSILGVAGKIPPEKFSGGCGGGRRWWGFTGEESTMVETNLCPGPIMYQQVDPQLPKKIKKKKKTTKTTMFQSVVNGFVSPAHPLNLNHNNNKTTLLIA